MCDSKSKRITIRLTDDDYNYLAKKSMEYDLPMAYLVRELIKQDMVTNESEVKNNG